MDVTRLIFVDILKKHPGCQVLIFNQAGQAGTTFPQVTKTTNAEEKQGILNNDFHSDILKQLLEHVNMTGEFNSMTCPYYLVGLGNGLMIALLFMEKYITDEVLNRKLKSIVSINGFISVDDHLAGILHSSNFS